MGTRPRGLTSRLAVAAVLSVLALIPTTACDGSSGPTSPSLTVTPGPTPAAPGFNLAGNWTGTIAYSGPGRSMDPASATIAQDGARIDATIRAPRFLGHFQGTLSGDRLSGSLTTDIEALPFGALASGTASASAIHLVSRDLRYQNEITFAETVDLSR